MKTAKEYIEENYGLSHLNTIMEMNDSESFIAIMQEYSRYVGHKILCLAAEKYAGIEMKDGFGCVCNVPSAIITTAIHLP